MKVIEVTRENPVAVFRLLAGESAQIKGAPGRIGWHCEMNAETAVGSPQAELTCAFSGAAPGFGSSFSPFSAITVEAPSAIVIQNTTFGGTPESGTFRIEQYG